MELLIYLRKGAGLEYRFADFQRNNSTETPRTHRPKNTPIRLSNKVLVPFELPDKRPTVSTDGLKAWKTIGEHCEKYCMSD